MERFIHKYSLGVAGFVAALVAVTIDGEIQHSGVTLFSRSCPYKLFYVLLNVLFYELTNLSSHFHDLGCNSRPSVSDARHFLRYSALFNALFPTIYSSICILLVILTAYRTQGRSLAWQ